MRTWPFINFQTNTLENCRSPRLAMSSLQHPFCWWNTYNFMAQSKCLAAEKPWVWWLTPTSPCGELATSDSLLVEIHSLCWLRHHSKQQHNNIFPGKLEYFTNLNLAAIWGWFPIWKTMIPVRSQASVATSFTQIFLWRSWICLRDPRTILVIFPTDSVIGQDLRWSLCRIG